MKQVDFKGLAILEFPDDWEDERILAHLRDNDADVTRFVSDQLKEKAVQETDFQEQVDFEKGNQGFFETAGSRIGSAASGAAQGVAAVAKMGGRMAELAPPAAAANVAGGMTRPVVTPELQARFDQTAADRAVETPQAKAARVEANPAVQWGKGLMDDVGEAVPALPGDRESFLTQVAQGVGTSVGGIAAGVATGPAGAMVSMWGAEADDAYDEEMHRQQQAGETPNPDKALLKAMGYGSIASAIEAGLGVGFLAKRLKQAFGGTVKEAAKVGTKTGVLPKFVRGVAEATAAGYTEEASQRLAQDLIVQGKPNWQAINQEGMVGSFTQGLLDVPAAARKAFRRQPTAAPLADTSKVLPETTALVDRMDEIITPPAALTAEDVAAIPVMRPGEASETGTPIPEDPAALAEQIRLTADPASSKAATLITPGEELPDELPEGLMQVKTPHGWVVFNPDKVSPEEVAAAGAGDRFDGTILGMADDGKAPTEGTHVVTTSTPDAKNVVTEIVPDAPDAPGTPDPAAVEVAAAAQSDAVPGGTTEVKPAIEVAKERVKSVEEQIAADVEEAWKVIQEYGKVSVSYLQRKLKWGYNRSVKAIAELEKRGKIGPANGATPRTINQVSEKPQPGTPPQAPAGVVAPAPGGVVDPPVSLSNETPQASEGSNARPVLEGGPTNEAVGPTEGATGGGTESGLPAGETGGVPVSSGKTEPQRGRVGQMLGSGEIVITKTGRKTTPFPKVNIATNRGATKTVREVDRWLMENAIAEAESIGDDFNATGFRANLKSPSQSDKDSAEEYLFGDSPPIQPPRKLQKPLTQKGGENREEAEEGRKEEGLLKTPEEKAPKAAPPSDDAAKQKAKADLDSALSDLADLFGTRLNIVPEQRQKVFPVMVRVMDAAFRLGYYKFKDAARFVLNTLRGRGAGNIADALTISDLQGAYIAMSSGLEGAEEASDVVRVKTKAEIEKEETKTPMVLPAEDAEQQWTATAEDTATRKIITGNLLAGFAKARGRVVVYSKDDGTTNTGILLPVTWKESGEDGSTHVVASEKEFLDAFQNPAVKLEAGPVTIVAGQVSVPASGTGRRVWSHAEFRRLVPRNQQKGSDIVGPIADPAGFYSFLSDTMGFRIDASAAKPPRAATSGQPVTDLSPEAAVAKVRMVLTEDGVDADIVFEPDWTMPTKSGGTVRVVGTAATGGQPMRLNAAVLAGKTKDQIRRYIRHELVHPHLATPWGIAQLTGWDLTAEQVADLQEDGYLQAPGESDQDYRIRLKDEFVAREAEKDTSWWKAFVQRVKEALAKLGIRNLTNDEIARRILRNIRDRQAEAAAAPAVNRLATEPARGPGSEERPGRAGPVGGGRPSAKDPERSMPTDDRGVPIQPGDRRRASSSEFGSPQYVIQKERERTLAAERFIDDSASLKDALDRLNAVEDSALRAVIAAEVAARAAEHIRLPGRPGVLDPIDAARLVERATREVQALKTDSAQGLQAQKQINRRLGPYRAILSYLELIRSNQQRRLGKRFPKVVSDNIRSWLRVSARQAVEAVAKAMQSPANVTTRKLREAARDAKIDWSSLFQASWETQRQVQVGLYQALRQHPDLAKLTPDEVRELTNLFVEAWAREHNAIFQREFRKKVRPAGVADSDLEKLVKALPRLIRYLNLGLLDDDRFLNAIAPEFGIGAVDDSTVIRLSELAQEAQATPEGVRQNKVYQRMVEEIWKTGGINPYDLARDFWFANILSGLRTWIDVGVGSWLSGLTMVGRAAADASFRGRPRLAARMVAEFILATGEAIANGVDIIRTGDTTRLPGAQAKLWDVLSGRGGHDSLEAAKASGKGWKRAMGQLAYVRRIMTALDYVGSMGTRDALMSWVALSRGDAESLAAAAGRYDRDARRAALEQAEAEMPGAKRVDQRARAREILESGIDREVRDAATVLGQVAALNADPVGIGGILYRLIAQVPWLLRAPAGLSFARAAINMAQNASDWMPVFGAVNWGRTLVSQTEWFQNLPKPLQAFGLDVPPERRRLIAAAQIGGMVLTAALLGLADDDDDEFEITGTWTGMPPAKRSQLMSQGERPLSIRIGDTWISYRNTPFAAAMAFVGNIRDKKRFDAKKWDNEEVANRMVSAWLMGALYIKDVSAMSQFAQLIGASAYSSTDELKSGAKWAADTIGNFGAGFIPGVSALREIDTMTDPGVYRPNAGVEYWLRNVPFARRSIGEGPAVNALGEEISNPRTPWSRWVSQEPNDPVWTVLSDHASRGVFLPVVSKTATIVGRTGERRQMNDEEFYAYQQAAGKAWYAALRKDLRFLQGASPEVAQGWMKKRVEDIHSAARRRVRPTE